MATAAQLEREIAPHFGLSLPKATAISQALREDKLLSSGLRGRGAPPMTALDAATLVAVWLVNPPISDATFVARGLMGTPWREPAWYDAEVFDGLQITSGMTFGDALASLIQDVCHGTFDAWMDAGGLADNFRIASFLDGANLLISGARRRDTEFKVAFAHFDYVQKRPAPLIFEERAFDFRILKKLAGLLAPPT